MPSPDVQTLCDLVLEASLEGLADHDLVNGTVRYNDRWWSVLGYTPETQVAPTCELWLSHVHADDLDEVNEQWAEHTEAGWPFQETFRMRHLCGGYRYVQCKSVVHLDDEGTPARAISLFSDVTEQVEAAARHKALVDAIPDTILRVDKSGALLDVRIGAAAILPADRAASQAATLGDIFSESVASDVQGLVNAAIDTQNLQGTDLDCDVGGMQRSYEWRAIASGTSEAVCVVRDITERKQLESQLAQAQKLESIGQLAAGVAHEINTPLQFIGDNTRFVKTAMERFTRLVEAYREHVAGSASDEDRARFRKLEKKLKVDYLLKNSDDAIDASIDGVTRVAEIVAAMKEFSHPGTDAQPTDINRCIKSTSKVSTNEWKHVAELELDLDETLPTIEAYGGEINQCLLNIIVNAAHALEARYGQSREGLIRVSSHPCGDGVEVRIADNGPGIPEAVKARIFDPFFTTKEVGKGTGQGLAISHRTIVQKHRGELICETVPGEGTTFVIRLPGMLDVPMAEAA